MPLRLLQQIVRKQTLTNYSHRIHTQKLSLFPPIEIDKGLLIYT